MFYSVPVYCRLLTLKGAEIMKKLLSITLMLTMLFCLGAVPAYAAEASALTPEQQAVLDSYENVQVSGVETVAVNAPQFGKSEMSTMAAAASYGYRGSYYRGSVLMWTKDYIEWISNGSSITSSTGWQEAGYIFPNIARATGISKHSTSSSTVTYRAAKTIGAGVVTPWGDVSVYEQAFTDFLRGYASGSFDVY